MLTMVLHPCGWQAFLVFPVSLLEICPEGTKEPLLLAATLPLKRLTSLEGCGRQLGTIGPGSEVELIRGEASTGTLVLANRKLLLGGEQSCFLRLLEQVESVSCNEISREYILRAY